MASTKLDVDSKNRRRSTDKNGRRFVVKDRVRRRAVPGPSMLPRKARIANRTMRILSFVASFLIFLATSIVWRARSAQKTSMQSPFSDLTTKQRIIEKANLAVNAPPLQIIPPSRNAESSSPPPVAVHVAVPAPIDIRNDLSTLPSSAEQEDESAPSSNSPKQHTAEHHNDQSNETVKHSSKTSFTPPAPLVYEELPDRIEWYSRDDYKLGTRPMCRISKPYILSNGTILVPEWMEEYENLLLRCGLGEHGYYAKNGPEGLNEKTNIDADFALTIHLDKFQEPTHASSIYLTEHILKASYLFDVFGGDAHPVADIEEHHCYTTAVGANCTLSRPVKALLKPALFVPKRIETGSTDSWSRKLVDMFGVAHGNGRAVIHLNTSSIITKRHRGKSANLSGTLFRSIMTTDGMFRHLPANALRYSNFYSEKNHILKTAKTASGKKCSLSIGIASVSDQTRGIASIPILREKIGMLSKLAVVDSSITVKEIEFTGDLEAHVKQMQDLDIFVAGSGDEMSSIGYLRQSSSVFELMPFGIVPNTHESLARALGIDYYRIPGKPQMEFFKDCVDEEVQGLRRKGKISFSDPVWYEPLNKAWDDAVSEYIKSGKSTFDILSAEPPVKNYYSRVCAQRQKIEVDIDETTRTIVKLAGEKCRK